jgi:hypothetical protein
LKVASGGGDVTLQTITKATGKPTSVHLSLKRQPGLTRYAIVYSMIGAERRTDYEGSANLDDVLRIAFETSDGWGLGGVYQLEIKEAAAYSQTQEERLRTGQELQRQLERIQGTSVPDAQATVSRLKTLRFAVAAQRPLA